MPNKEGSVRFYGTAARMRDRRASLKFSPPSATRELMPFAGHRTQAEVPDDPFAAANAVREMKRIARL